MLVLVGGTVTNCFGVAGMAVTGAQKGPLGLFHSKDALDKGCKGPGFRRRTDHRPAYYRIVWNQYFRHCKEHYE